MTFLRALTIAVLAAICVPLPQAQSNFKTVQLTITTIDVPGAHYTGVWGINSVGDMVGNYGQDTNVDSHGFLYSNGTFTYFDYPGQTVTIPLGINDSSLIAGSAGRNPVVGFLYDGISFTTVKHGSVMHQARLSANTRPISARTMGLLPVRLLLRISGRANLHSTKRRVKKIIGVAEGNFIKVTRTCLLRGQTMLRSYMPRKEHTKRRTAMSFNLTAPYPDAASIILN